MSKRVVSATWDDVPHLSAEQKAELWGSIPPYQRDARAKGIPQLGSGAIYPVPESEIVVDPFELPLHWPRGYGLDVGWNRTVAVWGAHDRDTDMVWLWSEHYRGQAEPSVHAAAIRARGEWMQGAVDPAARGRGQRDGEQLLQNYVDLGLQGLAHDAELAGRASPVPARQEAIRIFRLIRGVTVSPYPGSWRSTAGPRCLLPTQW